MKRIEYLSKLPDTRGRKSVDLRKDTSRYQIQGIQRDVYMY